MDFGESGCLEAEVLKNMPISRYLIHWFVANPGFHKQMILQTPFASYIQDIDDARASFP